MVYRKEMNQRLVLASNSGLHFQSYKLSQFPDSLAVERCPFYFLEAKQLCD